MSASSATALSRGVLELAARFLGSGHRVLVVDAAPGLALEERFGREPREGVRDCLDGSVPALAGVRDTGRLGLYLLVLGESGEEARWSRLGRVLDEARPHFGRVVLAFGSSAPAGLGEALDGMDPDGWWAGPGGSAPDALALAGRLGIHILDLDLAPLSEATLEALDARLWSLVAPVLPPGPRPSEAAASPPEGEPRTGARRTLECDLRVMERLRFLLWTRRVAAERRRQIPDRG